MKAFFHKSDLDGHCSGAIIYNKYIEVELIGVDYESILDRQSIKPNEKIFVLDFCFPKDDMLWLNKYANLIWCDHHKTSMETMSAHAKQIAGFREIGKAGCELTWAWVHPNKPIPWVVWTLGRYDVWDHEASKHILPFQYGMHQQKSTLPNARIWSACFKDSFKSPLIQKILSEGKLILKYEKHQNAKYAKAMSYEANFMNFRAIVMNKSFSNSLSFDAVYDPDKHDIMIMFSMKDLDSNIKYSIFSDKPEIDVSVLANKMGGGGHKNAAGFYTTKRII